MLKLQQLSTQEQEIVTGGYYAQGSTEFPPAEFGTPEEQPVDGSGEEPSAETRPRLRRIPIRLTGILEVIK